MKMTDVALATVPAATHNIVGIRPGEKLHEQMIGPEDAPHTYEYATYYKVLPAIYNWSRDLKRINDGVLVTPDFTYRSDNNLEWMSVDNLQAWIAKNREHIDIARANKRWGG